MNVLKMAARNVWRNKRRTLVTVGAMALALASMVVYSGLLDGYLTAMERNILDLEMGDVQIHAAGYLEKPSIYTHIAHPDQVQDALDRLGLKSTARVLGGGLAAAGDASAGVILRGVDPERDATVSGIHAHIAAGAWLSPDDPAGVVIGKRLARSLNVAPGDEVVVLTQGMDGSMANELYTIRGVLRAVTDSVDRGGVFLLDTTLRELLVMPAGAHEIIVRRPLTLPLDAAKSAVAAAAPGLEVKSWKEISPTLASMLEQSRGAMFMMFFIVYIAIGVVILNAMLMAVFERIRELGVLKALGAGPGRVLLLILVESGIQTLLAVIAGLIVTVPIGYLLATHGINLGDMSVYGIAWDPVWRARFDAESVIKPIAAMLFIVGLAILYPALKAALIKPLSAIRHR